MAKTRSELVNLPGNWPLMNPLARVVVLDLAFFGKPVLVLKGIRAHCYCASLVRTLYMMWHSPRHVFQARAPSRNSTKYRADDLCGNLISEYYCWMLSDPLFFFGRSLPFLILSIILRNKKICRWVELVHGYRCARLRSCQL